MSSESELTIEPLNRNHNRAAFNCGIESLDRYLKHQASQDVKRRISRVFVARGPQEKTKVLGYYTLSTLSIDLSVLPERIAKKLPRHPVPAALIGRLAVDSTAKGKGVGRMLLANAIRRTLGDTDLLAILAKNQTEPQNAVSRLLHFQALRRLKIAAHPCAARETQ